MIEIKLSWITDQINEYSLIYRGNENIILQLNPNPEDDERIIRLNRHILEQFIKLIEVF